MSDEEEDALAATREWLTAPHVVSEINTFLVTAASSEINPIVKDTHRIAKLSFSHPCSDAEKSTNSNESHPELKFDKDGDPVLTTIRAQASGSNLKEENLFIEFENSTTLDLVGLQIWRGALILADFIIHNESVFRDKVVLEVGSGTGLSSVVASFYASKVIATDLNEPDILNLIKANSTHNQRFVKAEFVVTPLDFTNLVWSDDLEKHIRETDVILAADVIYSNTITEAFIKTLQKCLSTGKPKNVFMALEKRYFFSVDDLDTIAPMYEHFMDLLLSEFSLASSPDEETILSAASTVSCRYNLAPVSIDFPQYFSYERTKDLVLWSIRPKEV